MKRRIHIQLISLLALHSSWGPEAKWWCNPVLSCHACVLSWFACPVGVFVHYSGYHLFPYFALGAILLIGAFAGRLLCGWVCPFGLVQDVLHKIPSPKFSLPGWTAWIKYVVLIAMVVAIPFFLGESTMYSFCRICPAATIQAAIPSWISGGFPANTGVVIARISVLAVVLILAVFSFRSFCKVLCPIGALMAPLNLIALWTIKSPREDCLACRKCDKACRMEGLPSSRILKNTAANRHPECMYCYDCSETCKTTIAAASRQ